MARGPVSSADMELLSRLRDRGAVVSAAQLERWRTAGVLPRNGRRGLGRGAGSVSEVPAESFAIAESLARATRRGRPLYEAVLEIFTADPRFSSKVFLAVPRPPLPEHAVREALAWFIRYRENSVWRRIERAVAGLSAEDAEDVAAEVAQRHYIGVYRSQEKDLDRRLITEGHALSKREALGHTVLSVANLLGQEAIGSERFAEAASDSFGDAGEPQGEIEALTKYMAAENIRRELTGEPLIGSDSQKHTIDADIDAIRKIDFDVICRLRDTLALLAEAAMIYEAFRASLRADPMIRHLLDFFTSDIYANLWVRGAAPIAYTEPAESWKRMVASIVTICSDVEDLADFEKMAERIDFTLDEIRDFVIRRPR